MPPTPPPAGARRAAFTAGLGFDLDGFQMAAMDAVDAGHNVVVTAPTGSGKTVVANYAVNSALAAGAKAFYTTPLKALSNQKYGELVARHTAASVGLLTGDNAINPGAEVVVMTTEVLRNMIYSDSAALDGLRYVVLDEVHYLQDAYRGSVWEEVIVHAPSRVRLVCLSATVSNADELAGWIRTVRGETVAVVEDRRPVELTDLYLVGDRRSGRLDLLPTLVDDRPNPEVIALEARARRDAPGQRRHRLVAPRRAETIELLDAGGMLPAIFFIFSRKGCDEAARACGRELGALTSPDERRAIRAVVAEHVAGLGPGDLELLGYGEWLAQLEAGFAAHHAGLVPPFKEAVEACFAAGLAKVVFATETLSLGINMPARSVVIEKLTKYTGERHELLSAGDYTQLTGRAGRRGIDDVGYAVVLWSPFVSFDQVAALAGTRSYTLSSSFRPTYNMAVNLVRRYRPERAHQLLNLSFGQYQADREIVGLEARLRRVTATLGDARQAATCERGDVADYHRAVHERDETRAPRSRAGPATAGLERVRPGDVVVTRGRRVAVLTTSRRRGGDVRLRVVTPERRVLQLGAWDFPTGARTVGRVTLPTPFAPGSAGFRRQVASALEAARLEDHVGERPRPLQPGGPEPDQHPVASCPEARAHLRAFERAERLQREAARLERAILGRSESLARQLDRVLRILEAWGYVAGWALTDRGERLAGIYHEMDLVVAECLSDGLLDGLDPAELAGVASVLTYESRRSTEGVGARQGGPRSDRPAAIAALSARLERAERAEGLPLTRSPDAGFVDVARRWAGGDDLAGILADEDLSGGDFVRNVKQLVDLLRQVGDHAPDPATARSARQAGDRLLHGVVAASSLPGRGPSPTSGPVDP